MISKFRRYYNELQSFGIDFDIKIKFFTMKNPKINLNLDESFEDFSY